MLKGICRVILAAGLCHAVTAKATLTTAGATADGNWSLSQITIPGVEGGLIQASSLPKAEVTGESLGGSNIGVASSYGGGVSAAIVPVPEPTTALLGALLLLPLAAALRKTRANKPE
jgi:hypothetical protein